MAQKGMLTLTGKQRDESGEETVVESRMPADYYEKDGASYILCQELHEDTGETIKNVIKYRDSMLEMTRRGSFRSRMVFEPGRTHRTDYVTPFGTLSLETSTRKAEFVRLDNLIRIRLEYTLASESRFLSDCTLDLCLSFPEA